MHNEIGTAAGDLWNHLSQKGPLSLSQLKKDLPLTPGLLDRAIGWLAREGKISEVKKGRTSYFEVHP